jgi:hypothetical protein
LWDVIDPHLLSQRTIVVDGGVDFDCRQRPAPEPVQSVFRLRYKRRQHIEHIVI